MLEINKIAYIVALRQKTGYRGATTFFRKIKGIIIFNLLKIIIIFVVVERPLIAPYWN